MIRQNRAQIFVEKQLIGMSLAVSLDGEGFINFSALQWCCTCVAVSAALVKPHTYLSISGIWVSDLGLYIWSGKENYVMLGNEIRRLWLRKGGELRQTGLQIFPVLNYNIKEMSWTNAGFFLPLLSLAWTPGCNRISVSCSSSFGVHFLSHSFWFRKAWLATLKSDMLTNDQSSHQSGKFR